MQHLTRRRLGSLAVAALLVLATAGTARGSDLGNSVSPTGVGTTPPPPPGSCRVSNTVNAWNYSLTSGQVTARNVSCNAGSAAGASITIGFQATHTGNTAAPPSYTLNGAACTTGCSTTRTVYHVVSVDPKGWS
jgi:hypothetical protein